MDNKIKYWVDLAEYDLETAKVMLESRRFLYVGFMAHQSIEKILKAYFVKVQGKTPPFTHNLSSLVSRAELKKLISEKQLELIDILDPLNIEARYPTHKEQLLRSLSEERCRDILEETKELLTWIKSKL